jgi:hypothetical protein
LVRPRTPAMDARRKSKEHVSRPLRSRPQSAQRVANVMILISAGENAAQLKQPTLRVAATQSLSAFPMASNDRREWARDSFFSFRDPWCPT